MDAFQQPTHAHPHGRISGAQQRARLEHPALQRVEAFDGDAVACSDAMLRQTHGKPHGDTLVDQRVGRARLGFGVRGLALELHGGRVGVAVALTGVILGGEDGDDSSGGTKCDKMARVSQGKRVGSMRIRAHKAVPVLRDEVGARRAPKRGALGAKRLRKLVKQGTGRAEWDEGGEGGGAWRGGEGGALAGADAVSGERLKTDGDGASGGDTAESVSCTVADVAGGAGVLDAVGWGCGKTKGWGGLVEGATAMVFRGFGDTAGCWGEGEGGRGEEEEGEEEEEEEEKERGRGLEKHLGEGRFWIWR